MENTIIKEIRSLRLGWLYTFVVSVIFFIMSLCAIGGFERFWYYILIMVLVLGGLGFASHELICIRLLKPVKWLDQISSRQAEMNDEVLLVSGMEAVSKTAFWEAIGTFANWVIVAIGFFAVWVFGVGINNWQALIFVCISVLSGLLGAALVFSFERKILESMRRMLETKLGRADATGLGSGKLSKRLLVFIIFAFVTGMIITSLTWLNRAREAVAKSWLKENETNFQQLTYQINQLLRSNPTQTMRDLWTQTQKDQNFFKGHKFILMDGQGSVIGATSKLNLDRAWLSRIARQKASIWLKLKAPFLYFSQQLSNQKAFLVEIGPTSIFIVAFGSLGWPLFGLFMIGLIFIAVSVIFVKDQLRPISVLSNNYHQASNVEAHFGYPVMFDIELFNLVVSVEKHTGVLRNTFGLTKNYLELIDSEYAKLNEKVSNLREASEQRNEVAEQTATSVTEMRSSIQSISEQMESLREASNDCTSAMFEIDQSIKEVSGSVGGLQKKVEETATSTEQITVSIEDVAENIDELAKMADESVTSIAVIDSSIKQVENSTAQTHLLSEEMTEYANKGADSVRLTIAGIEEIQMVTQEAREVIDRLGSQMEAVGKILTVIVDVAEQTNLLALNAAIIAAAAGEHGKGFAVVADEIKDLADRTSTSTKEIAGLIRSVQTESRRAIEAMKRGTGSVTRGVDIANNAGEALQQILHSVTQVNEMANDIATSTTEHSRITRNIARSMSKVSAMVREVKKEVKDQSTSGKKISKVSAEMRDDAKFVSRSTTEQVQAANEVSRNMGRISEMVSYVGRAMVEQSTGVDHVAKVADEVRDNFEQERIQLGELEEVVDRIIRQSKQYLQNARQFQPSRKNKP